ncbi:copper chaperone for superoxide dismutase isoform X2 [Fopius arisanus]|uniref:Extracellular superoxide dismutase [Cu-Zn] n=1 Tax=Fopius arisanus TaxID=64838 RepID=A0A9R1U108_9HYME|nr:PREDICTED: copper chaperone for superoxide dismutase-like isoform X2 [Fopius arisanus]
MTTKVEFAVDMTCQNCVKQVEGSLRELEGIHHIDISLERGTVLVNTDMPYSVIQEKIESLGKRAVLKGYGDNTISAVSIVGGTSGFGISQAIQGVVRFVQTPSGCIIDGTVDGLSPGAHGFHVHECGDISGGCDTVGDHFNPYNSTHGGPDDDITQRHIGDLGNILANESGRAQFRWQDKVLNVDDIIGRSLVITEDSDDLGKGNSSTSKFDGNSGQRLACGIIARSSGVFENTKRICACDGKTLWDERDESKQKVCGNNF